MYVCISSGSGVREIGNGTDTRQISLKDLNGEDLVSEERDAELIPDISLKDLNG